MGRLRAATQQSEPCPDREKRFQIVALLIVPSAHREDPLHLAIFSARNGSAGGARRGIVPALGADGARRDCSHRISKPSDRHRARGVALTTPPFSLPGNRRWGTRRSHLAVAAAKPKGARADPKLRIVLDLVIGQRLGSAKTGCGHRHVSSIAGRTFGMVAGVLEARSFRLRSARSLAGSACGRRRGQ